MDPPQRRKVAIGVLGALFITIPAIFTTWWYIFSSTPPYQWFRENGLPAMNFPLLCIAVSTLIGFVLLGSVVLSIRKENISTADSRFEESQAEAPVVPVQEVPSYREPQAVSVALDDLKEMLREGEKLVARFSYGECPTADEIRDYKERTLAGAKWRVFEPDRVRLEDIERFEEPWDEDEVILKKAALIDAGRLPSIFIDPDGFIAFDRAYGRVERLKELIGVITGKVPHAQHKLPAVAAKTPPSPSMLSRLIEREPGPRNVPPKNQVTRDGVIYLTPSPEGLLNSIESEINRVNEFLNKYSDLLESYAPQAPPSTHAPPPLREVVPDFGEHCLSILRDKGWMTFSVLAQHLGALNQQILKHNETVTAKSEHAVRKWSEDKIPKAIHQAKLQATKRLS